MAKQAIAGVERHPRSFAAVLGLFLAGIVGLMIWFLLPPVAAKDEVAAKECDPQAPTLLTGKPDGFYFALGQAIQEVAGKHGFHICAHQADQTLLTPSLLDTGNDDFGLVQSDVAHDAWYGHPGFVHEQRDTTRLILPLYVEAVHIVVRPHLSISRVADLKGKKVWLGPEGSATEYTALRILRAAGLNPDEPGPDIQRVRLSQVSKERTELDEAHDKLVQMNDLDAFFRVTVMPSSPLQQRVFKMTDGKKSGEIRLFGLDYDLVDRLSADGSYIPTLVPPELYDQSGSTLTVGVQALLLAGTKARATDAHELARIVRSYRSEIEAQINGHNPNAHASLSLLNVPTSAALSQFIYKGVAGYLYDRWRDSIRPILPVTLGFLLLIVMLMVWQRPRISKAFRAQSNIFLLVVGTLAVWCMASATLYHFEWSVNEHFNSFPRSLQFAFLYLVGVRGYSPLTPNGQTAADVTKWLSVAVLGGFATPLVRQGWEWLSQKLGGSAGKSQSAPATPTAMPQPPLKNRDVLDMCRNGLAPEIVVIKVRTSAREFDTSVPALCELKATGVPDAVILAMLDIREERAAAAKLSA